MGVAAWFEPAQGSTDSDGSFATSLFLAGAWALSTTSSVSDNIQVSVDVQGASPLTLTIPVVLTLPHTVLDSAVPVQIPSVVMSPNTIESQVLGIAYLPSGTGNQSATTVEFSVLGIVQDGKILPMPSQLHVWFSDASDSSSVAVSSPYTMTAQPFHTYCLFMKVSNGFTGVAAGSQITYGVEVAENVSGTRFLQVFNVTIIQPHTGLSSNP